MNHMPNKPINFIPKNSTHALALIIARTFSEERRLPYYLHICKTYGHDFIYRIFKEVMSVPSDKIKKSRRALFHFLLKKYEESKHRSH